MNIELSRKTEESSACPYRPISAKRMSAADAIRVVKNGDTIVVPTAVGEPPSLLTALSDARRDFRRDRSQILAVRKYGYLDPETVDNVRHTAYFFSGATRPVARRLGRLHSGLFLRNADADRTRPDAGRCGVSAMASPMDEHGFFSLALAADYTMAAIRKGPCRRPRSQSERPGSPTAIATSTSRR